MNDNHPLADVIKALKELHEYDERKEAEEQRRYVECPDCKASLYLRSNDSFLPDDLKIEFVKQRVNLHFTRQQTKTYEELLALERERVPSLDAPKDDPRTSDKSSIESW